MAFVLSRAPSPSTARDNPQIGEDTTHFPRVTQPSASSSANLDHDMPGRERENKSHIEIILDSPHLYLKGTGVDVEPTRLSGHVVLYLTESTSIKEITLQFRGKARLPPPPSEIHSINAAPLTYIVCTHDWSFLEGEKKHSHTLKAGRHLFPFQLRIGGSLPSTISSSVFGGASVVYKLRAQAVRTGFGFHHNLQTILPVPLLRSFSPEAMEYQQTLEIENTWPEKLMYSIMLPHKAWAAGDKVTALAKFSPLTKGVSVLSVSMNIQELAKISSRSGIREQSRVVALVKYEISNGRAVEVDGSHMKHYHPLSQPPSPPSPANPPFLNILDNHNHTSMPPAAPQPPVAESLTPNETGPELADNSDVSTYFSIYIPPTVTPSHALEPIIIYHRIRWSILLHNPDGHTSELRCSLPIHLLDHRLLSESRIYSAPTRRLLFGESEGPSEEEEEMQLPSYNSHTRDRVANMFLPESATMRVTNPWISQGTSPTHQPDDPIAHHWPLSRSGHSTPLEAHPLSHLPHQPGSGTSTPLDWVNSELLLSLSDDPPPVLQPHATESGSDSDPLSRTHSRSTSTRQSRLPSRAPSVEREHERHHNNHTPSSYRHKETYIHSGHASRSLHSLFTTSMKPLSSFSPNHWISRSASHPSSTDLERPAAAGPAPATAPANVITARAPDPSTGAALLHRAFTAVPDYSVASRGFIGGVPPLTSMRGLPSYEETQRTQSESDLARHFARAAALRGGGGGSSGSGSNSPQPTPLSHSSSFIV